MFLTEIKNVGKPDVEIWMKIFGTGSDSEIRIVGHICLILYRKTFN
jgi:hypothetical protein